MNSARSYKPTDPLSDVFSLLDIHAGRCTRFEAGGAWALRFPAKPALKFGAVLKGECWFILPETEPARVVAGDAFLLANAPSYMLANDPQKAPEDGIALFDWAHSDVAHHGGDDTVLVAGAFAFESAAAELLLDALPIFMRIPGDQPSALMMRETLAILDQDIRGGAMGASLVVRRLAEVLLVQVLRAYASGAGEAGPGWVAALADLKVGQALRLLHGDVAHRWTVDELARAVGMSRSGFATRFKERVGLPPLDYLLHWRMELGRDFLRRDEPVAKVARRLGYASESAFANAFKRVHGTAPKRYWRVPRAENP
ncbi:AraC family transcriptional regulator [Consotaella aegiceratis]|uniref:AraC family transcriptional regulator n=1 Tax=Consotaella aegiceratis TaxID=3097961 RepID=UPI002F3EB571